MKTEQKIKAKLDCVINQMTDVKVEESIKFAMYCSVIDTLKWVLK